MKKLLVSLSVAALMLVSASFAFAEEMCEPCDADLLGKPGGSCNSPCGKQELPILLKVQEKCELKFLANELKFELEPGQNKEKSFNYIVKANFKHVVKWEVSEKGCNPIVGATVHLGSSQDPGNFWNPGIKNGSQTVKVKLNDTYQAEASNTYKKIATVIGTICKYSGGGHGPWSDDPTSDI